MAIFTHQLDHVYVCDTATPSDVTVQACLESTCVNATGTDSRVSQDRVVVGRVTAKFTGLIENRKYLVTLLIHDAIGVTQHSQPVEISEFIHDT